MSSSGTVSVDDAGAVTGTGDSLALYNSIAALAVAANPLPDPDHPDHDWEGTAVEWHAEMLNIVVKIKRGWAREAQGHAAVLRGRGGIRSVTASTAVDPGDDYIAVGTRSDVVALTIPAGLPVGHEVEAADDSGQAALYLIALGPAGGETVGAVTEVHITANYGHVRLVKTSASNWTVS
jgi:hypothetical protein